MDTTMTETQIFIDDNKDGNIEESESWNTNEDFCLNDFKWIMFIIFIIAVFLLAVGMTRVLELHQRFLKGLNGKPGDLIQKNEIKTKFGTATWRRLFRKSGKNSKNYWNWHRITF